MPNGVTGALMAQVPIEEGLAEPGKQLGRPEAGVSKFQPFEPAKDILAETPETRDYFHTLNNLNEFAYKMISVGIDPTSPDLRNPDALQAYKVFTNLLTKARQQSNTLRERRVLAEKIAAARLAPGGLAPFGYGTPTFEEFAKMPVIKEAKELKDTWNKAWGSKLMEDKEAHGRKMEDLKRIKTTLREKAEVYKQEYPDFAEAIDKQFKILEGEFQEPEYYKKQYKPSKGKEEGLSEPNYNGTMNFYNVTTENRKAFTKASDELSKLKRVDEEYRTAEQDARIIELEDEISGYKNVVPLEYHSYVAVAGKNYQPKSVNLTSSTIWRISEDRIDRDYVGTIVGDILGIGRWAVNDKGTIIYTKDKTLPMKGLKTGKYKLKEFGVVEEIGKGLILLPAEDVIPALKNSGVSYVNGKFEYVSEEDIPDNIYEINGVKFNAQELYDRGWADEQIERAVRQKSIKKIK